MVASAQGRGMDGVWVYQWLTQANGLCAECGIAFAGSVVVYCAWEPGKLPLRWCVPCLWLPSVLAEIQHIKAVIVEQAPE